LNYQREMLELNQQRRQEIKRIQGNVVASKHSEAKTIKKQSFENALKKQEIIKEHTAKNQEKKGLVRLQEDMALQKINTLKQKKRQEFKMNYEQRVQSELERMKQKQTELANMEKAEGELIKKLQNTQQTQKNAFYELENAIKYQSPSKTMTQKGTSPRQTLTKEQKVETSPAAKTESPVTAVPTTKT